MGERVEIVRALLEMFKRRENETPFAFYEEDIVWDVTRFSAPGLAGLYEGHAGVREFWRRWLEAWEDIEWEYTVIERDDQVIAQIRNQRNLGRGSGVWVPQPQYEIAFSFRENRVCRVAMVPVQT